MAQLLFEKSLPYYGPSRLSVNNASMTFCAMNFNDSISFNTVNMVFLNEAGGNRSMSVSLGLYSLSGSTLSLANSVSSTFSQPAANRIYISMTSTSATQNITPGIWYIGYWMSRSDTGDYAPSGQYINLSAGNAFPGAFIGGAMTVSTNALPSSYATSDLDITGQDALLVPFIIMSA